MRKWIFEWFVQWRQRGGVERLCLADWPWSITLICSFFAALFFLFGFWWPYWRAGDMDIWMVYQAFLSNDHLAQEYFDHPGYLTILFLGEWLRLLHACGLLAIDRLSQLPPVTDIAGSALAWTRATQAGRLLSLLFGIGFVTSFAVLLRRLIGNWQVAALAAFMLAFSGGLMMEARIIRTELVSAGFAYGALLILLIAATRTDGMRPLLVGIAAFLATGA